MGESPSSAGEHQQLAATSSAAPPQAPSISRSRDAPLHSHQSRSTMNDVPDGHLGDEACANCGKHGNGTVKLKNCTACRLVKYCGVDCQRAHRKQHKKACKQREAELKDEQLYSQGLERPEGHFCPICTLPIPLPIEQHSLFTYCCMKRVCNGCLLAVCRRGMGDTCPSAGRPCQTTMQLVLPWSRNASMLAMRSRWSGINQCAL